MEIKRQIIESKFPPSNKAVWWFDLNTKQLKRWVGDKWSLYSLIPMDIPMPGDKSLLLIYDAFDDFSESTIKNFYDSKAYFGKVTDFKTEYVDVAINESDYTTYIFVSVSFENPVVFTGNEDFPGNAGSLLYIKIPNSIRHLPSFGISLTDYSTPALIIGPNIKSISSGAIYTKDTIACLVCLAEEPPVIEGSDILVNGGGPYTVSVFVPDEFVNIYKKDTNWSYFTIEALSEYDDLLTIKKEF